VVNEYLQLLKNIDKEIAAIDTQIEKLKTQFIQ